MTRTKTDVVVLEEWKQCSTTNYHIVYGISVVNKAVKFDDCAIRLVYVPKVDELQVQVQDGKDWLDVSCLVKDKHLPLFG